MLKISVLAREYCYLKIRPLLQSIRIMVIIRAKVQEEDRHRADADADADCTFQTWRLFKRGFLAIPC
jgi:hypothetical protein